MPCAKTAERLKSAVELFGQASVAINESLRSPNGCYYISGGNIMKKLCLALSVMILLSALSLFTFIASAEEPRNMLTNYEVGCIREPVIPAEFSGYIGTVLDVGDADVTVTGIGRMWYPGNVESHELIIVDAAEKKIIASVDVRKGTEGQFSYSSLEAPVVLTAGSTYYLLSSEDTFGDTFGDFCEGLYATGALACNGYVYDDNGAYIEKTVPGGGYLAIDLQYTYTPAAYETKGDETPLYGQIIRGAGADRNNFGSYLGTAFYIDKPIVVKSLGRYCVGSVTQNHVMMLVDGDNNKMVPGSLCIISEGTPEEISYADLEAPVYLEGEHLYYLVSREYMDGDKWLEGDARHVPSDPSLTTGFGWTYYISSFNNGSGDYGFVGVNLKYQLAEAKTVESSRPESESTEPEDSKPADSTGEGRKTETVTSPASSSAERDSGVGSVIVIAVGVAVVIAVVVSVVAVKGKKK